MMTDQQSAQTGPRIAIVGMILESNAFSPALDEAAFRDFLFVEGEEIVTEARRAKSRVPRELAAFVATMDATGPWTPIPVVVTASPPGGPVDHEFFQRIVRDVETRLAESSGVDGVYVVNHGAMTTTAEFDGDGIFVEAIRGVVGASVPVVMTLDLHANISDRMVDNTSCIIGYRTNPHVDQVQRGEEAGLVIRQLLAEQYRAQSVLVRLPLTPASVTLLTHEGPYCDVINYGQRRMAELGGAVVNVSVFGGFVFSDTPKNGFAVVVTARDELAVAETLANEIAQYAWSIRERFTRTLLSEEEALTVVRERIADSTLPAIIFSDAGDNPGGGGSGRTAEFLERLVRADVTDVVYGCFYEPGLAKDCHDAGVGATVSLTFNAQSPAGTGGSASLEGRVLALNDGMVTGRRGIYRSRALELGPVAAVSLGKSAGVTVVLISLRVQAADPVLFEMLGIDPGSARVLVVKSRGHFRAGFDEWFSPSQVREVDTVGYTSPVLERFDWKHLARPVFPLDPDANWPRS